MKELRQGSLWIVVPMAVAAAGCGGGQSGGGASTSVHTSKSGYAVLTYSGQPKPQLGAASGLVSTVGQAGATYSAITLEPPPNLNDTFLIVGRVVDEEIVLYKVPYATGVPQLVYQNNNGVNAPAISAYGTIIFDTNALSLETVRADGTDPLPLAFTGATKPCFAAYAFDGTDRLAFSPDNSTAKTDLDVAPGTGGAATVVQKNDNFSGHAWNPAGTSIAYSVADATAGNADLYVTPSAGGTAVNVTPTTLKNTGLVGGATWNADGQTIVAEYIPSGENSTLIKFNVNSPASYTALTPSGGFQQEPTFSPDGTKLAYYDESSGGTDGIYISDAAGDYRSLFLPDPSGQAESAYGGLAWSRFLPRETVAGVSGSVFFHQSASGYLLTLNGSQFGSFLAFTAGTPSSASIQESANGSQGGPMLFTITADSLTSIGYMNDYFSLGTTIGLSSTPSAVVSIDGSTGQVDLVAPSATAKNAFTKNADGTASYTGNFKAVYDGKGNNLAPSGASKLVLNTKTGKLLSYR